MWSHLRNQWSKQTNFVDLQFFFQLCTFCQKLVQKVVKKGASNNESILFNSTELSVHRTSREFQN